MTETVTHFDPDGKDTVTVFCGRDGCTWGTAFQYDPDNESISEFAVAVATAGLALLAKHHHAPSGYHWSDDAWEDQAWSTPEQRERYRAAFDALGATATPGDALEAFHTVPYEDSYDREMFFEACAHRFRFPYETLYQEWLHDDR